MAAAADRGRSGPPPRLWVRLLDADTEDQLANILGADRDELAELLPLLGLELFDRKACNQALATCAAGAVEGSRR